jgi:lactoylglutathione lyase
VRYVHTMVRVRNLEESLDFYCNKLGLIQVRRTDYESGRYTLVFLAAEADADRAKENMSPTIELTYNWDAEDYGAGRNFGHLAFRVKDIYETCQRLVDRGVTLARPPRDGRCAFVRSPDEISIELLQDGPALPKQEPWASMQNVGSW